MSYTFTLFDSPSGGTGEGQGTYPLCMNNNDTVAGVYIGSDSKQHGFIRTSDGTITEFNVSGATETFVAGINSSNTICGFYYTGGDFHSSHGFVRTSDGTITTFDVPTGVELNMGQFYLEEAGFSVQLYSVGNCINNAGTICGIWRDSGGTWHGFLRDSGGVFTTFDLAGDYVSGITVVSINNNGDVCGSYLLHSSPSGFYSKSFLRTAAGTITEFASTSAGSNANNGTLAYIVNDSQQIGGYYADSSGLLHGFIRNADGTFTEYDVPGTINGTLSTCINASGQTTGWYPNSANSHTDGFIRNTDGTFITFDPENNPTDVILSYPYAINTSGCVTGSTLDDSVDDVVHGFIGCPNTPPPPPVRATRCVDTLPSGAMVTTEITRDLDADWNSASTFIIQQSDPLPFTLRGIVMRMTYNVD